jgi:hypothetical protein
VFSEKGKLISIMMRAKTKKKMIECLEVVLDFWLINLNGYNELVKSSFATQLDKAGERFQLIQGQWGVKV